MGNTCSSLKIPLRIAAGIAIKLKHADNGTGTVNITDAPKAFVKTSELGCFDCPGSVISVCNRDDAIISYLIVDPKQIDNNKLKAYAKAVIIGNLKSLETQADFIEYLNQIKAPLGIKTVGDLANIFAYAIDQYLDADSIYENIYGAYITNTGTNDLIMHVAGRVPAYWCAIAQSNMQNLNSVIIATSIIDTLSLFGPAKYALDELQITARRSLAGEIFAHRVVWLVLFLAVIIAIILIAHLINVRWRLKDALCPFNPLKGIKVSC